MNPRRSVPISPAFAILGAAALALGVSWTSIPSRWPIHWDAAGHPNGWAHRDPAGVFGLIVLGAGIVLLIELASRRRHGQSRSDAVEGMVVASRDFMRAIATSMAMLLAFLAVDLPLGPHLSTAALGLVCAVPVLVAIVFGSIRVAGAARELRRQFPPGEGYRRYAYSNAKDSRLWVPRPGGMGVTVNFAHPLAWPVMVLLVAVPIAFAFFTTFWR